MRVFLDANVLFSASHAGSSLAGLVAWLIEDGTAVTSDLAVEEARRNLALKRHLWVPAFDALVPQLELVPSMAFRLPVALADKDVPLLCAAIRGRCELFVTGDRRDVGDVMDRTVLGVRVVSTLRLAKLLARQH
jgi:predicted nucleic acid-binding protein